MKERESEPVADQKPPIKPAWSVVPDVAYDQYVAWQAKEQEERLKRELKEGKIRYRDEYLDDTK